MEKSGRRWAIVLRGALRGSNNFAGWHIAKAQAHAKTSFMDAPEQGLYNLNARMIELERFRRAKITAWLIRGARWLVACWVAC